MRGIDELCAVAAVCALCAVLCSALKKHSPEHALLLALGCCAAVLAALLPALRALKDELAVFGELAENGFFGCVVKAAGACLIAQFASDACSDAGQSALAGRVSFAGRLASLFFALPLLKKLALSAAELIEL